MARTANPSDKELEHPHDRLFWSVAAPLLERPEVERSTMMGSPCLRADRQFFAMVHVHTKELLVKVSADRVAELVESGLGAEFKPAGRVFREWVSVSQAEEQLWQLLMEEGRAFVSGE